MEQRLFAGDALRKCGGVAAPARHLLACALALCCCAALLAPPALGAAPADDVAESGATRQGATEDANARKRKKAGTNKSAVPPRSAEAPKPQPRRRDAQANVRGPDVTLIAGEERTIYEYRHNGQLRMIKVVPKFGKPYYLAPRDPTRGFGDLEQADSLIAEWVLWEF